MSAFDMIVQALQDWYTDILSEDEVISIHHESVRYGMEEWEAISLIKDAIINSDLYDADREMQFSLAIERAAWQDPA